ncbi:HNH endonuclease [Occultella gossypii]|uniref:HNH endonuclease n=1 Tax=Occultella gossypii TaxID=2800820 RepID=A0ABS7S536_9MICO|nr:HNH endonuclease signature motif containing protein [Occultella gossypii]MBZ2195397.1 HNH endonuclease [Occultella gossypii]
MASWILSIDKNYSNHWELAKIHNLWDMTQRHEVHNGDVVYFWTGGIGFVGWAEVAGGVRPLGSADAQPWTDSGKRVYKYRFEFGRTGDLIGPSPTWTEVMRATGFRENPSIVRQSSDPVVERALWAFVAVDEVSAAFPTAEAAVRGLPDITEDRRERVLAEIAIRQGQGKFRDSLLAAYDRRCAVTGCTTVAVLEAAHISPYRGTHTNAVANGLLLRADIHTLFDLNLLTVVQAEGAYAVRVEPSVADDAYRALEGAALALPRVRADHPDAAVLDTRNRALPWLTDQGRGADIDLQRRPQAKVAEARDREVLF